MRILPRSSENTRQRRTSPRSELKQGPRDNPGGTALLIVTDDLVFLAELRSAATACAWRVRHAPSFDEASVILATEPIPIVVYDSDLAEEHWRLVLPRLGAVATDSCILLASRVADEYLWQEVVRHHGYDILVKSGGTERMISTLQFAWFWRKRSRSLRETPKAQIEHQGKQR
jgi:DNA-binding NtrC family response regulator